jgi:hypothetical protein
MARNRSEKPCTSLVHVPKEKVVIKRRGSRAASRRPQDISMMMGLAAAFGMMILGGGSGKKQK